MNGVTRIQPALATMADDARAHHGAGISDQTVAALARELCAPLPPSYTDFLRAFGFYEGGGLAILGVTGQRGHDLSLIRATRDLRLQAALAGLYDVKSLVPVERIGETSFVCLDTATPGIGDECPVIRFTPALREKAAVSESFADYLLQRTGAQDASEMASSRRRKADDWGRFEAAVKAFDETHHWDHEDEGGRLPAPKEWRPYRMAVQDVLLGAVVIRHNTAKNNLQVDCCIIDNLEEYADHEATRFVTLFLLCEAYQCGGTMEIEFTREQGRKQHMVPGAIHALAQELDVQLASWGSGRISAAEARALFVALTPFPQAARESLALLTDEASLSRPQACFAVHHGDWTVDEMAWLLIAAVSPGSILSGATRPEDGVLFARDLHDCCDALLGGQLDDLLMTRPSDSPTLEDDPMPLDIDIEEHIPAKSYVCGERLSVSWAQTSDGLRLEAGATLLVAVHAWSSARLRRSLGSALETVASRVPEEDRAYCVTCVLVPWDFHSLTDSEQEQQIQRAESLGIHVLISPEPLSRLEERAIALLDRAGVMRKW